MRFLLFSRRNRNGHFDVNFRLIKWKWKCSWYKSEWFFFQKSASASKLFCWNLTFFSSLFNIHFLQFNNRIITDLAPGLLSCEQARSWHSSSFACVETVTGLPLPGFRFPEPVSLILFTKFVTAVFETSNDGCSFQILYAVHPFSLKSFSITEICPPVKLGILWTKLNQSASYQTERAIISDQQTNGFKR